MHVHSFETSPQQALEKMKSLNIRYLFVASIAADLPVWAAAMDSSRFLPAQVLPCPGGHFPLLGRPQCWEGATDLPDTTWLRSELRAGRIKALGEMAGQYFGWSPNDARFEPYWELAEEFDVPIGIHMGPSPPLTAYRPEIPNFRMAAGEPLLLEDVLLRHKRLRLFVMHAGWPHLESMLALLQGHPNVYVDVAALQIQRLVPQAGYYRHLRGLVEGGFAKRIMFGSDFSNQVGPGIDAILAADFLSAEQKADILCDNAARFLRLSPSVCSP
jgi:hypothetical protein